MPFVYLFILVFGYTDTSEIISPNSTPVYLQHIALGVLVVCMIVMISNFTLTKTFSNLAATSTFIFITIIGSPYAQTSWFFLSVSMLLVGIGTIVEVRKPYTGINDQNFFNVVFDCLALGLPLLML